MKYCHLAIAFPFLSLADRMVNQQNLILRHYGFDLLNAVMQDLGYLNDEAEVIAQHGCWCGKINPNNEYQQFLGGPDPVDGLDEICKEWFKCRNCNDRLPGGTCNDGTGLMTREYLSAGEYTISVNSSSLRDSSCVSSIDNCSSDSCTIDLHYVTRIINYYADPNNFFQPVYVTNDDQCSTFMMQDIERSCTGTVPYLEAVPRSSLPSTTTEEPTTTTTTTTTEEPTTTTTTTEEPTTTTSTTTTTTTTTTEEPTTTTTTTTTEEPTTTTSTTTTTTTTTTTEEPTTTTTTTTTTEEPTTSANATTSAQIAIDFQCDQPIDLVVIMDGSAAYGSANFALGMDWLDAFVAGLNIGPDFTRISLFQYSGRSRKIYGKNFESNYTEVQADLVDLRNEYIGTNQNKMDYGIYMAYRNFNSYARDDSQRIGVTITNGASTPNSLPSFVNNYITDYESYGIKWYAIGVGSNVVTTKLNILASDPDSEHVFVAEDTSVEESVAAVAGSACEDAINRSFDPSGLNWGRRGREGVTYYPGYEDF